MTEIESLFRDRIYDTLGTYMPNDVTLNNFSSFLYREFLGLFSDIGAENIVSEIAQSDKNTMVDRETFVKAVKDLMYFMAQRYMMFSLRNTMKEIKKSVPMVEREVVSVETVKRHESSSNPVHVNRAGQDEFDKNVGSFDIDIDNIPKAEQFIPTSTKTVKKPVQPLFELDSNSFSGVDLTGEDNKIVRREEREEITKTESEDLTMDASSLTEGTYDSVPKISVDLDY